LKHYGDISALHGDQLPPVDIITFGSPCQDMSICGLRAGLDGSRSSLFYEAIRIIKEMRLATNGEKPRWICWENFSAHFPPQAAGTSKPSLKRLSGSKNRASRCLRLTKINGPTPTAIWVTDGAWRTEFSMLNTGVYPNAERESSLSQILEVNAPRKYYLSQKACMGILRRAESRGKVLPEILRNALEQQTARMGSE